MINPDGVVVGNSRSNLQGKDMNKCYGKEDKTCHEVQMLKNYIEHNFKERAPKVFLDIHGHDI